MILTAIVFLLFVQLSYYDNVCLKFENDNEIDIADVKFEHRDILDRIY